MYTQLLKEAILQIEDDHEKSIREFADYCRDHDSLSPLTIKKIKEEYSVQSPIWWYIGPYCIYSMLNYGLRMMDTDIIMKMSFFIRHLQKHFYLSGTYSSKPFHDHVYVLRVVNKRAFKHDGSYS